MLSFFMRHCPLLLLLLVVVLLLPLLQVRSEAALLAHERRALADVRAALPPENSDAGGTAAGRPAVPVPEPAPEPVPKPAKAIKIKKGRHRRGR